MKACDRLQSIRRRLISVGIALGLAGCVSIQGYPNDWPELASTAGHECQALSGLFAEAGEYGNGHAASLTARLFPKASVKFELADRGAKPTAVRFAWAGPAQLRIQVHDADLMVHEESLQAGSGFQCTDGVLTIGGTDGANSGGALGIEFKHLKLSLVEPFLVVQSSSTGGGIFFLVPVVAYQSQYARFPRIDEER